MTLVLVSQPEIPSFAGTMSRGSSWSTRTSWADAEIQGFHGPSKKTVWFLYIHFKGPHIFVQILCTQFGLILNFPLTIHIYILHTMLQIICRWNDYPDQPIGPITWGFDCQPSNPFQPWAGTQGWKGIYNHFWIQRIHLCIKYSITI